MNRKSIFFIRRLIFSAVIFFVICIPFRRFFSLIPGMTEIRPANVAPPVLGISFGLPGAMGISVGNFVSDMLSGTSLSVSLAGLAANFLYAYIPYKMWYTMGRRRREIRPPGLNSVKEMLKYIYIIFVDSFVTTTLLAFIFEAAGFQAVGDSAALLFFNNFDFAMILGVPILAVLGNSGLRFQVPPERECSEAVWRFWDFVSVIPYFVTAGGIAYFVYSLRTGCVQRPGFAGGAFCVLCAGLALYVFRPMKHTVRNGRREGGEADYGGSGKVKIAIKAKVTAGFLMVAVVFIAFSAFTAYMAVSGNEGLSRLEVWSYVYYVAGAATNIIFAVTLAFLWYVEGNVTNPVAILSNLVAKFARQNHSGADDNKALQELCRQIRTGDEIEGLAQAFGQMMDDIDRYVRNLAAVTAEKEHIGAELGVARQIQEDMLPCLFPAFPDRDEFDIYATMTPAKEVGGDFYDFFLVDDDHLAVVMADVSGKGVPAALFMVISKTLIKSGAQMGLSPKGVLEKVNNQLCENNRAEMFVTVWLGILEISSGKMKCANAGHEYPFIRKKGGTYQMYQDKHGFVLAGMEGVRYEEYGLELQPGDRLFVYTDGVVEATNAENELYGMERALAALNRKADAGGRELLEIIHKDIRDFVKAVPQFDDITMLSLEYKGRIGP